MDLGDHLGLIGAPAIGSQLASPIGSPQPWLPAARRRTSVTDVHSNHVGHPIGDDLDDYYPSRVLIQPSVTRASLRGLAKEDVSAGESVHPPPSEPPEEHDGGATITRGDGENGATITRGDGENGATITRGEGGGGATITRGCAPFSFPWQQVRDRCLRGRTSDEIEERCGEPPCIDRRAAIPRSRVRELTSDLPIERARSATVGQGLVRCGWAYLTENIDLARYALCLATGNPRSGNCLERRIAGEGVRVRIRNGNGNGGGLSVRLSVQMNSPLSFVVDGWVVRVDMNGANMQLRLGAMNTSPLCACISMAAGLLHELVHSCWRDLADGWGPRENSDNCPIAAMVAGTFAWMMAQRYGVAANNTCCGHFLDPRAFLSERNVRLTGRGFPPGQVFPPEVFSVTLPC